MQPFSMDQLVGSLPQMGQQTQELGPQQASDTQYARVCVKSVTDRVKDDELKNAMSLYGKIVYYDINRGVVSEQSTGISTHPVH